VDTAISVLYANHSRSPLTVYKTTALRLLDQSQLIHNLPFPEADSKRQVKADRTVFKTTAIKL
jgi:hypothetical protein